MSKLKFLERAAAYPRETRRINFAEYHPDLEGDFIECWVNWSREFLNRSFDYARVWTTVRAMPLGTDAEKEAHTAALEALNDTVLEFQAEWLDIPSTDMRQLYEIDTALYSWVVDEANRLRSEYVDERKKAESGSSDT